MDSRVRPCFVRLVKLSSAECRQPQPQPLSNQSYKCSQCSKSFKYAFQVKKHAIVHSDSRPFSCQRCKLSYKTKGSLDRHELVHSKGKFPCSACGYLLRSVGERNMHIKTVHSGIKKEFPCSKCPSSYSRLIWLSNHIRITHDPNYRFSVKCPVCEKVCAGNYQLREHMMSHTNEKPHSCLICKTAFGKLGALKVHMERFHSKRKVKPFSCLFCERSFYLLVDLMAHLHSHTREKPYSCKICENSFTTKFYARQHTLRHSIKNPFSCPECSLTLRTKFLLAEHVHNAHKKNILNLLPTLEKDNASNSEEHNNATKRIDKIHECNICHKFFNSSGLQNHMYTHTGERFFKCSVCAKSFNTKKGLKSHTINIHQEKKKKYPCSDCSYVFGTMKGLYNHFQRGHARIPKTLSCKVCPKEFYYKCELDKHMMIHTGVKRYQCVVCEKWYRLQATLYSHIQVIHNPNEKPYFCNKCPSSFSSPSSLKRHFQKMHEDKSNRKFKCIICNKGFLANRNLVHHLRVHVGERPYPCTVCGKRFFQKWDLTKHARLHNKGKVMTAS